MDEAGNTGENLLDVDQPVYALAAIRLDEADVELAMAAALARTQMPELRFKKLRTSNPGRRNILTLLRDIKLTPDRAVVAVTHKPWMLAAKLIDELVEPRMLARGVQMAWYAGGAASNMAHALHALAPRALGELYRDLAKAFQSVVRNYSPEAADELLRTLRRCRIACRDHETAELLSVMIDSPHELRAEFESRHDALDPAVPSLFWQGGHWSAKFQRPFEVLHDDSNTVRRWAEYLELIGRNLKEAEQRGEPGPPHSMTVGDITLDFPTRLDAITFGHSDRDSRLQVADIVAGSAAHIYAVATGARPMDAFARDLSRAGVGDLIHHELGPPVDQNIIQQLR